VVAWLLLAGGATTGRPWACPCWLLAGWLRLLLPPAALPSMASFEAAEAAAMHDWQARSRGCGPHLQASAPERFGFVLGSSILDGMEGRGQRRARGPGAPPAAVAATAAGRPSVVGGQLHDPYQMWPTAGGSQPRGVPRLAKDTAPEEPAAGQAPARHPWQVTGARPHWHRSPPTGELHVRRGLTWTPERRGDGQSISDVANPSPAGDVNTRRPVVFHPVDSCGHPPQSVLASSQGERLLSASPGSPFGADAVG
jgi:hypothetical protein